MDCHPPEAWLDTSRGPGPELDPCRKVPCHRWDRWQGWVCEEPAVVRAGRIQSVLHAVNGAVGEQMAHSSIRKLHTDNQTASLCSLNISAVWRLWQIVSLCDSPGRGWKHLYISLLVGMPTVLGLQRELLRARAASV